MSRPWDEGEARGVLRGAEGGVLGMLLAVQGRFGFVPEGAVGLVAEAANVSRAEVHGVLTFYHDLRTAAPAGRVIRLCRAEACQAVGCEDLVAEAGRLGVVVDGPASGGVAVESVYCLGNCALGPAALVGEALFGRVDAARLRALVAGG